MDKISRRYAVFAVMWVLAAIFHMIHRSDIVSDVFQVLTVLSGVYVLVNPFKEIRLVVFALFHACVYLAHAPNTGNHEFFAFFVDLTILVLFSLNYLNLSSKATSRLRYLIPLLKVFTVVLYFFAVFHKLNWNYLAPNSCGGTMLLNGILERGILSAVFGDLSSDTITILRQVNTYTGLSLEFLIPIFLLSRRYSWIGCLLGIVLHGALGFVYFWHFTPMLYALFILFLPDSFFNQICRVYRSFKLNARSIRKGIFYLAVLVPILFLLKYYFPEIESELGSFSRGTKRNWSLGFNVRTVIGWLPFLIYTLIFAYFVVTFNKKITGTLQIKLPPAYYIFPLLLVINGFSPYLGFKTHHSFSMFSGLQTHENSNNHLFMPTINLVNTQEDVVIPCKEHHTNYPEQLRWKEDEKLVFYELQKRVSELKKKGVNNIALCFWRNGKEMQIQNAEQDSSLTISVSWVDKKFRIYREIPINNNECFY